MKYWLKMGRDVKNMRNVPNAKGTKFCWKAVEDVENKPKVNKLLKNVGRCQKRAEWFQAKIRVEKVCWDIGRDDSNAKGTNCCWKIGEDVKMCGMIPNYC